MSSNSISAKRTTVGLIGPIQPFRGGIAQYTTQLHRALMRRCDGLTLSFTRQYPSWLFPGQDERDSDYAGHLEPGVDYSISPYRVESWWRAVRRLRQAGVEQVVMPWWTAYWSLCFGFIAWQSRRCGIRVTFLCHNVQDHEHSYLSSGAASLVLRLADDYLVHTQGQQQQLRALYGPVSVKVHPHPIYTHFPAAQGSLHRRAELELLFYGFVRRYKGVDVLLDALRQCHDMDYRLTIAGEVWGGKTDLDALVRAAGLEHRVDVRPRYHGEAETAELFARADCVVLPYRNASASGVVALAYHYDKPLVVTRVGGLAEAVEEGLSGFVVPPKTRKRWRRPCVHAAASVPALERWRDSNSECPGTRWRRP